MVTGANGFVGVHLIRELIGDFHGNTEDYEVIAVDNLRYGPWRFSEDQRRKFRAEHLDIRDGDKLQGVIEEFNPQAIIHLAAIHFIPECENQPDDAISTNLQGTVELLRRCPTGCRFVFTSSAAVYSPRDTAHDELISKTGPVDVYGFSKLHGEDYVQYFGKLREFETVIVRLFNVIGADETNPHVLPEIIKQLKGGARTLSLGNVHPKRDYVHVQDVAQGFIALATRPIEEGCTMPVVVNLGSGKEYSVSEVVQHLSAIVGEDINIKLDPARVRAVDRPNLLSDNRRIQRLFGWCPRHELTGALQAIWEDPNLDTLVS
jgi:UDP-glucose 4-epimerase